MKTTCKFALLSFTAVMASAMVSCSDDDKTPDNPDEKDYLTKTIGFKEAPSNLFSSSSSGAPELYTGDLSDAYLANIEGDIYAQFSINYGLTSDYYDYYLQKWQYSFYNGGIALSHFYDDTEGNYTNQLSVYAPTSPSGGNFAVSFGNAQEFDSNYIYTVYDNPQTSTYSNYSGCGKIYLTDSEGYTIADPGEEGEVSGVAKSGWFKSVSVANTTYDYLVMKEGNNFTSALNEANKGWFKVQFIAFAGTEPTGKAIGWTEFYLANFDLALNNGKTGIVDTWTKVDLSMLPQCSVLVINLVGSDTGEYGLSTPAYCALDQFEITVEK